MAKIPRGKQHRAISYSADSAIRRREFRHSGDGPEVPRRYSRKDTKRWCRGVVGREHRYEWGPVRYRAVRVREQHEACVSCGKRRHWRTWFVEVPSAS